MEEDPASLFGQAVRQRREKLELSQEKLAEKADLHRTYIGDIERGVRNPTIRSIVKIVRALDISLSDFFAHYFEETGEF
jgi:transcriptional regulator with XRE-family HTH domain